MGPNTRRLVHPRFLLAGLLMLFGLGALFTSATAQDEVESEATTVAIESPVEDRAIPEAESGDGDDGADDTEAAVEDDAAVAALPDTGSGSGGYSTAIVLTASALAAATLGLAAIGVRRVFGRREA